MHLPTVCIIMITNGAQLEKPVRCCLCLCVWWCMSCQPVPDGPCHFTV